MGDKFYLSTVNGIFCWTLNFGDRILDCLRSSEGRSSRRCSFTSITEPPVKPDSPRVPLIGAAVLLVVAGMQACVENWAVALIGDAAPLTWQPANMDKGARMVPTLRSTKSTAGIRSAAASQYACSPIHRTTWQAIRESAVRRCISTRQACADRQPVTMWCTSRSQAESLGPTRRDPRTGFRPELADSCRSREHH
jgi:hypothetical protein